MLCNEDHQKLHNVHRFVVAAVDCSLVQETVAGEVAAVVVVAAVAGVVVVVVVAEVVAAVVGEAVEDTVEEVSYPGNFPSECILLRVQQFHLGRNNLRNIHLTMVPLRRHCHSSVHSLCCIPCTRDHFHTLLRNQLKF